MRELVMQKLNVSREFTDSLTLIEMGEPYSSNIRTMKKRARDYRQSIINTFK